LGTDREESKVPRPVWKGSLSFGLVNIPVGLYTATRDRTLHFHQIEAGTSDRIRYKKVNERTGKEVATADIAKAMDTGGGEYVVLSDEELETASPQKSKTIEIEGFVDLAHIDPIYYRTTYYLAPSSASAAKAYNLLREAMDKAQKVGIATFVMRNKEYLVAIRPEGGAMALETMYFSDEVQEPTEDLPNLSDDTTFTAKEREMATTLIDSLAEKWDPSNYHDSYREQVEALIEERRAGHHTVAHSEPEAEAGGAKVIDLLEALQASVKKASGSPARSAAAPPSKTHRSSAKPGAAKKASKAHKKSPSAAARKRAGGAAKKATRRAS
jgi:DNA end-binding protein Ku